jgi:pentapeptide MXKDX repeat protein
MEAEAERAAPPGDPGDVGHKEYQPSWACPAFQTSAYGIPGRDRSDGYAGNLVASQILKGAKKMKKRIAVLVLAMGLWAGLASRVTAVAFAQPQDDTMQSGDKMKDEQMKGDKMGGDKMTKGHKKHKKHKKDKMAKDKMKDKKMQGDMMRDQK